MNQNLKFLATVTEWTKDVEFLLTRIFRESVKELAVELLTPVQQGGLLPYRTGNLQRSFWLSTSSFAVTAANQQKFDGMQDFVSVADSLYIGDVAYLSLRAAYARRRNYGFVGEDSLGRFYNDEGTGFVERTALAWPSIVDRVTRRLRDS